MPRLVDETLNALADGDIAIASEGIDLAISFFEASRGQTLGLWRAEVLAEPASLTDLVRLRQRLVGLAHAGGPLVGSAVFALGKLCDPDLVEFFVDILRHSLPADANVLYQAMIALDNLGIDVFSGRGSKSVLEEDANRELAAEFLGRFATGSG